MNKFFAFAIPFVSAAMLSGCIGSSEPAELSGPQKHLVSISRDPRSAEATHYAEGLKAAGDPDFVDPQTGLTPLEHAAHLSDIEKMTLLLKAGADPAYKDLSGGTVLHFAASLYDTAPLELLLKHTKNPDPADKLGKTPLMEAARLGNIDAVKVLLNAGASLKVKDKMRRVPLSFAASARKHSLEMVKLLLEHGADRAVYDDKGCTPLFHAIDYGNTGTALYLLSLLPDFNLKEPTDLIGFLAMKHAIFAGNKTVVRQIIGKKLILNSDLSLVYKGMSIANIEGLHELLAINNVIADGKTPLFWAAEAEQVEIIKILAEAGADVNGRDNAGNAPVHYARQYQTIKTLNNLSAERKRERQKN